MNEQERELTLTLLREFEGERVLLRTSRKNVAGYSDIGVGTLHHNIGDIWKVVFESATVYFNLSVIRNVWVCTSEYPAIKIALEYLHMEYLHV